MQRYLDPKNDVAFKKLFGVEERKPLLISFLNSILQLNDGREIEDVEYIQQEELPFLSIQRRMILDVRCTDKDGNQFIVEMQNHYVPEFAKRMQFYAAYGYVSQLSKGDSHIELKPIIVLAIANFNIFPEKTNYLHYHKILDVDTNENNLKDISFAFVELDKFNKTIDESSDMKDEWIYFLKYADEEERPAFNNPLIIKAYDTMEKFGWSKTEFEAYLSNNIYETEQAALQVEKFAKGKEEGIVIGRMEGMEMGRMEEKIATAQKLLGQNVPIDIISTATGLTKTEIESLL